MALAEWVRPIAYCERDRFCHAVLLSRMRLGQLPRAVIWDDIATLRSTMLPRNEGVDIIYGGFPCQDISIAGAGVGLAGKRSGLYTHLYRLIGELRPKFVFMENVPAITLRGLEQITLDLTALGYDSRWTTLSAGELGAPHLRKRWWLLAHPMRKGLQESRAEPNSQSKYRRQTRRSAFGGVQASAWKAPPLHICRMDDGLPFKTHRIRSLGNAVVPLQAREAFMRLSGL